MNERGILFSAPMVLALLVGTKTQTRRAIKTHRSDDSFVCVDHGAGWWPYRSEDGESDVMSDGCEYPYTCPYGVPGDRIWVRERWSEVGTCDPGLIVYYADYPGCVPAGVESIPDARDVRWSPSIHMRRRDSRITLEIESVRVERLQDISEVDAKSEGCEPRTAGNSEHGQIKTYRTGYVRLWNEINGPGSWLDNPWVWVVCFRRIP